MRFLDASGKRHQFNIGGEAPSEVPWEANGLYVGSNPTRKRIPYSIHPYHNRAKVNNARCHDSLMATD